MVQERKISELFKIITGNDIRKEQLEAVLALLSKKQHLIFKAPTGGGKTPIGLIAYLYDYIYCDLSRYDRLVYSLPRTSLANQVVEFIKTSLEKLTSAMTNLALPNFAVQTGERPEDPHYTGDIVVTSDIQLLARYANIPIGTTSGTVNIGTGSFIGSLIVIDEVHLLEPGRSMGTMLDFARRMQPYTQILLMTATFSDGMMEGFKDLIEPCVIEMAEDPVDHSRVIFFSNDILSVNSFLNSWDFAMSRTIVMFNTVKRARQFFRELSTEINKRQAKVEIQLLHSYFLQSDRQKKLNWLYRYFGAFSSDEAQDGVARILVTTQVIEVGVDISAGALYTELCPASSLIQRSGRCARFNGQKGQIYVFALSEDENNWWLPYRKVALERTREALAKIDGKVLNLKSVQQLVNRVHEPDDRETFDNFDTNLWDDKLLEAFGSGSMWFARELIRASDTISVIVCDQPDLLDKPWSYESMSLSIWNLAKLAESKPARKGVVPLQGMRRDEDRIWRWIPIKKDVGDSSDRSSVVSGYELICIASEYARYSFDTGFELCIDGTGGGWQSPVFSGGNQKNDMNYSYCLETLQKHLRDVAGLAKESLTGRVCGNFGHRCANALKLLAEELGLLEKTLHDMVVAVCLSHDLAKSSSTWQQKAWHWQREYERVRGLPAADHNMIIGHTDVDPNHPWVKENIFRYRRPPHAMESAVIAEPLISTVTVQAQEHSEGICRAALMAITKHHNASVQSFQNKFELVPEFLEEFTALLSEMGMPAVNIYRSPRDCNYAPFPSRYLLDPRDYTDAKYLPVYWLLVRVLRLADWKSQSGEKNYV